MRNKIACIPLLALLLFSIGAMESPKKKDKPLALIGSDSTTIQESGPTVGPTAQGGALTHPVVVVNTSNQPLTVEFSTTVKCCSSGNQVSNNFTITVRLDGVPLQSQNFSLPDMGYDYSYVPISWSVPVAAPGNATHVFDVFVNSGGWEIIIFSSPTQPTFMNIYQ